MDAAMQGRVGYLAAMTERPISYSGYPDLENLVFDWHQMPMANARELPGGGPTLRAHGFTAFPHKTAVETFDEGDRWHAAFIREIETIVKAATGASEVLMPAVSASYRNTSFTGSQGAAHFCHNDYTPGSAARHITALDPVRAEERLSKRFAAYNLWRLVSPPPQNQPLALCDARSVAASDVVPGEARFFRPEGELVWGEIACFRYNPAHRWYYFPDLSNDEILIWCGYDSDPSYASIVPHTAIFDSTCPAGVPPRANVECRCYALFD